jgi:site-specific DNA recombinase
VTMPGQFSVAINTICTNRTTIKQKDLEARVLDALAHHLMDPEAVKVFCEAYTAERNRLAAAATTSRTALEKELTTTRRDHAKLVDAIIAGVPADQVKDKMIALDARRKELEAQLAQADASPAPVRLHPKMSETYRERVAALIRALAESEGMEEAREAIRGLIEKIVLNPRVNGPGLTIDLHGALASLLLLATGAPTHQVARMATGGQNAKNSAGAELQGIDMIDKTVLVAGVGFEPTTFRL